MHLDLCVIWYILDEVTGLNIMAINLKLIHYFHLVSFKLELVSIPKVLFIHYAFCQSIYKVKQPIGYRVCHIASVICT